MAAIALKKVTFGSDPKHQNMVDLFTMTFPSDQVIKLIEAGVDINALVQLIFKDGVIAFQIAFSLFTLLSSGTTNIAALVAWAEANYKSVYSIAQDVAALFGVTLPPLPISPGPAKP